MGDPVVEALRTAWPISRALTEFTSEAIVRPGYANCPFCYHLQTTPSPTFHFDDIKWYCFRCQAGGDVFKLVQGLLGIGFHAVLEKLSGGTVLQRRIAKARIEETLLQSSEITNEDETRERLDFVALDLMIQRCLRKEITLIRAMQRWGELTEEEAQGEIIATQGIADSLFEELDRVRTEMLYYLRRNFKKSKGS